MTDKSKNKTADALRFAPEAPKRGGGQKNKAKANVANGTPYNIDFPDDCPIEPLGVNGDNVYFLDVTRQLRTLKAKDLNRGNICSLLGDQQELKFYYWPRLGAPDENDFRRVTGWRPEQAGECLLQEASRRGLIDIMDRVRGPGSWMDGDGQLIMHCGDKLYRDKEVLTPQSLDRYIYPAAPTRPHPSRDLDGKAAAEELLSMIRTWSFRRPDLDPHLLLGWIGAAILGGALTWRPLVWITGDKATGKSTLHEVLKGVFGQGGIINTADTTAAGVWQQVGHASLPVAVDELEAEEDNRKAQNIIKLARAAASGSQMLRGGADHSGTAFTVRNCFLFSSILIPPMLGQDVSRMAVLQLDKLEGTSPPSLEPRHLEQIGQALRARLLDQWHRFPEVLHIWKSHLAKVGHGGRSGDQFGTLLACFDILLHDTNPHSDMLDDFGDLMAKDVLSECEDDIADHERCISFLMTSNITPFRSGEQRTVGSWVMQATSDQSTDIEQADANKALGNIGMMVRKENVPGAKPLHALYIANDHNGIANIFRESHWAGRSGANGVWVQAFRRIKHSEASQQRFNGLKKRCTKIYLEEILGANLGVGEDD